MEGGAFCLLPLAVSVISFCSPVLAAEFNSKSEQSSFSVSPSSGGDAIRRLLGLLESESDVLPSDSS